MKYPFSQLIREILPNLQEASAPVYNHTPSAIDVAKSENFRTQGGVTLADFFVNPPRRVLEHAFVLAPRNQTQSRFLQLRKEGI